MVLHDPAKNLRWIEFDWICCLWLMSNLLNTWQLKYSRRDLCLIQIQLGGKVFDLVWNFLWFYNLLKHLKKCIPLLLSFLPPNHSGVGAARSGNLTFMVGGVEEEFAAAQELLGCMGSNVVYCGAVGTGQAAKICNNLLLAISMIGTAEAMNMGIRLGLDPKLLAKILNMSSGRCWSSDTYNPVPGVVDGVPSANNYQGGFGTTLMAKVWKCSDYPREWGNVSWSVLLLPSFPPSFSTHPPCHSLPPSPGLTTPPTSPDPTPPCL